MWPFRHNNSSSQPQAPGQRVLSLLSSDEVRALGHLPGAAIVGVYTGQTDSLETFQPNRAFLDLLHRVMEEVGMSSPEMAASAAERRTCWMYVIDPRTPDGPDGEVAPEDIIGVFEARDGKLVQGSYQPNPNYRVLTANGPTQLTPAQRARFLELLAGDRLCVQREADFARRKG